jgi:hypothetical protein
MTTTSLVVTTTTKVYCQTRAKSFESLLYSARSRAAVPAHSRRKRESQALFSDFQPLSI